MVQAGKRKIHIDFIRIIAIYMVLFNHTGTNGFLLFTTHRNSPFYPLYLLNAVFIKAAVPLFFMITGALLLKKQENYTSVISRFVKFSFILFIASIISYIYRSLRLGDLPFSIKVFFATIYTEPVAVALWYMYAYLAYLLMLPVLRCIARNIDKRGFWWMFLMYSVIPLLTIAEYVIFQGKFKHYSGFSFFISSNTFIYPLMGYYIENKLEESDFTKKRLFFLTAASIASIAVCAALTHWNCTAAGEWDDSTGQTFLSTLIFIPAFTVYYGIKMFFEKHTPKDKICRVISTVGGATFGLYLIEIICRRETRFVFDCLDSFIPTIFACWIWIFCACCVGIVFTLLIKKIKIVSRFI